LQHLEQEPFAALGLVDGHFEQAGGRHILILVADLVRGPLSLRQMDIVLHQLFYHLRWGDEVFVIVFDRLQLADMADGADRCAAYAPDALSYDVDCGEDLVGVLVEEQMVVAEVRACQMPVEVLRFYIQSKQVRNQRVKRLCDLLDALWLQICDRCQLRRGWI
jgi:hypothetical protein